MIKNLFFWYFIFQGESEVEFEYKVWVWIDVFFDCVVQKDVQEKKDFQKSVDCNEIKIKI